jgi:hypothetical protein
MNARGDVAVVLNLADGNEALAVIALPEPERGVLVAVGALVLAAGRRRS